MRPIWFFPRKTLTERESIQETRQSDEIVRDLYELLYVYYKRHHFYSIFYRILS
jgi:hypothetical protein